MRSGDNSQQGVTAVGRQPRLWGLLEIKRLITSKASTASATNSNKGSEPGPRTLVCICGVGNPSGTLSLGADGPAGWVRVDLSQDHQDH